MAIATFSGAGVPGSGQLVAIYGGSPAGTLAFDGVMQEVQTVETFGTWPGVPAGTAKPGDPLIADGVTIWLRGVFPAQPTGVPVAQSRATTLATWDSLRAKLLSANYELFLHYEPGGSQLYRKHRSMNTVVLRAHWADPVGLVYVVGATSSQRTLYTSAPGLS